MRNVNDVTRAHEQGRPDGALAGLYRLRHGKPTPSAAKASEIATLIGDLYFDEVVDRRRCASIASPSRSTARAKKNDILVDNSVRALGERSTYARARRLILDYVGRGAAPALKRAAKSGATPQLRRRAQKVLATLESKSYRSRH